jgi:hypothetical protein
MAINTVQPIINTRVVYMDLRQEFKLVKQYQFIPARVCKECFAEIHRTEVNQLLYVM